MDTAGLLGHFLSADEGARRINDAAAFPVAIYQREENRKPILVDAAATDADAETRLVEWSAMLLPGPCSTSAGGPAIRIWSCG